MSLFISFFFSEMQQLPTFQVVHVDMCPCPFYKCFAVSKPKLNNKQQLYLYLQVFVEEVISNN